MKIEQGDDLAPEDLDRMIAHERFLAWCDRAELDPYDPHTGLAYERHIGFVSR